VQLPDWVEQITRWQVGTLLRAGSCRAADTDTLGLPNLPGYRDCHGFRKHDVLSQAATRIAGDSIVFDRSPYVVFWVIDPDTDAEVPCGQHGRVVMNHISKGVFILNNLERDTAIGGPAPTVTPVIRLARSHPSRW
jgi:hypothetical protein